MVIFHSFLYVYQRINAGILSIDQSISWPLRIHHHPADGRFDWHWLRRSRAPQNTKRWLFSKTIFGCRNFRKKHNIYIYIIIIILIIIITITITITIIIIIIIVIIIIIIIYIYTYIYIYIIIHIYIYIYIYIELFCFRKVTEIYREVSGGPHQLLFKQSAETWLWPIGKVINLSRVSSIHKFDHVQICFLFVVDVYSLSFPRSSGN